MHPECPFFNLPLLVYEEIFGNLEFPTIQTCRLVCTEWYTAILKLSSKPNGFCITAKRYAWNTANILEAALNKSFEMKDYEDSYSPIENLKLENVNISDCLKLLEKSPDFRETVGNVTHLNITNAFFGDCETFILFLSKFKKLRKLGIIQGNFSSLEELSVFHLGVGWIRDTRLSETKLSENLKQLYIEVRQDCSAVPLLLEILFKKIVNLTELHLKVIPFQDGFFKTTVNETSRYHVISPIFRTQFFLCWFLASILQENENMLKSLRIDWKINTSNEVSSAWDTELENRITEN